MAYRPAQIQGSSVGGFTQGSVPFAASDGTLTENNGGLFWTDSTRTLTIGDSTVPGAFAINGAADTTRDFKFQTAGVNRWIIRANNTAESGSDAGSDLDIVARTDAGANIGNAIRITRATRIVQIVAGLNLQLANIQTDTVTGTKIATATTQKLGFWNATPVVQPADPGDLTDNTGGTVSGTLAAINNALAGTSCGAVGCTSSSASVANVNTQLGIIRNAIASVAAKCDSLRAVLSAAAGGVGLTA